MSGYSAIASLTKEIRNWVSTNLPPSLSSLAVETLPPDKIAQIDPASSAGMSLYPFRVLPNLSRRNQDQPVRSSVGTRLEPSNIALDIHYLFSFFGGEAGDPDNLDPVLELMGFVMLLFESNPKVQFAELDKPVYFTQEELDGSDVDRLYSDAPYRTSLVYRVTPVLLVGDETPSSFPPVLTRNLDVRLGAPIITGLTNAAGGPKGSATPLGPVSTLEIHGNHLQADTVRLRIEGQLIDLPAGAEVTPNLIRVPLDTLTSGATPTLQAGVLKLQVVHPLPFLPSDPSRVLASNTVSFSLHPSIASVTFTTSDSNPWYGTIVATARPAMAPTQESALILNRQSTANPTSVIFGAQSEGSATFFVSQDQALPDTDPYSARLRIDGVDSLLDTAMQPQITLGTDYPPSP